MSLSDTLNGTLTRMFTPNGTVDEPSAEELRAAQEKMTAHQALTLSLSDEFAVALQRLVDKTATTVERVKNRKLITFSDGLNVVVEIRPFQRQLVLTDLSGLVDTVVVNLNDSNLETEADLDELDLLSETDRTLIVGFFVRASRPDPVHPLLSKRNRTTN